MTKRHFRFVDGELVEYKPSKALDQIQSIEFDEKIISLPQLMDLSKEINYLACTNPNTQMFAEHWAKTLKESFKAEASKPINQWISALPDNLCRKLDCRENPEMLYLQLYQSICLISPLILLESGIRKVGKRTVRGADQISSSDRLEKSLKRDISFYEGYLAKSNLIPLLVDYVERLQFSTKEKVGKNKHQISRAQYAMMVLFATGLSEDIRKIVVFYSKTYADSIKKEKITKVMTHLLCCIIYKLLTEHPNTKYPSKNFKGYCRTLTAEIINTSAPKEDGKPQYTIDERGVEYALTGR